MSPSKQPPMVAYRSADNKTIHYVSAPQFISTNYDSDSEPLIAPSLEPLSSSALQHFTATGRPLPKTHVSALQSMAGDMFSLPQLLPRQYTDDSVIPAIVTNVIPKKIEEGDGNGDGKGRRKSWVQRLKGEKKKEEGLVKVVYMPRREYLKFFARGLKGEYVGSEAERRWTEEELEEAFGEFRPKEGKKGYRAPT